MKELRCGKWPLLRILDKEGITITRVAARDSHYCFISREHMPGLIRRHANESARVRRMRAWTTVKGSALVGRCPHCGKTGKQHRGSITTAGNLHRHCRHCGRSYTPGAVRRPPLEATCPQCGATAHQWRRGVNTAGNRGVRCGHCMKDYTLRGNPDYVPPPGWVNPRRLSPEDELLEKRKSWANGPLLPDSRFDGLLLDMEAHSARMDAELAARQSYQDQELRARVAYSEAEYRAISRISRPPLPGEPPYERDPAVVWNELSEARREIAEELAAGRRWPNLDE